MKNKNLFFAALFIITLAVSGCGAKKPAVVEPAPAPSKPSINSFSISQEPVPAKTPTPVKTPEPAPIPETNLSTSSVLAAAQTFQVEIKDFSFNPAEVAITVGSTVAWTNSDAISHDIKSASFNSSLLSTGQTFRQEFTVPGVYDYSCDLHPSMKGKIIVK